MLNSNWYTVENTGELQLHIHQHLYNTRNKLFVIILALVRLNISIANIKLKASLKQNPWKCVAIIFKHKKSCLVIRLLSKFKILVFRMKFLQSM